MPYYDNTIIGHVIDVQGDLLIATLVEDDQGHVPSVTIGDEDVTVGQLGSYVAVRQSAIQLIAIVTRMTEQEAHAPPSIDMPGENPATLPFRQANRPTHACRVDCRRRRVFAWCLTISDNWCGGPCNRLSGCCEDV